MGNAVSSTHHERRSVPKKMQKNPEFRGAGCLFTNGDVVLAGYQTKRGDIIISGLGGNREEGESYLETALRETVEELFDIKEVPSTLIEDLKGALKPLSVKGKEVEGWGIYVTVVYTFEHLHTLLKYAKRAHIKTRVYETFPTTVSDLLLQRKASKGSSPPEIGYLTIIPIDSDYAGAPIKPEFLEDMETLYRK